MSAYRELLSDSGPSARSAKADIPLDFTVNASIGVRIESRARAACATLTGMTGRALGGGSSRVLLLSEEPHP